VELHRTVSAGMRMGGSPPSSRKNGASAGAKRRQFASPETG
jgi:hypothetical protein